LWKLGYFYTRSSIFDICGVDFRTHLFDQTGSGADPGSYKIGTGAPDPGIKKPGREADHSSPDIVPKLRIRGAIPLLLQTSLWRGT
jgi:hypothetical protein